MTWIAAALAVVAGCEARQDLGVDRDPTTADDGGTLAPGALRASPFAIVQQLPAGGSLNAIWGADRDHVFAVGSAHASYIYRAGIWQKRGGDQVGVDYFSVWGSSATNVFAVGKGSDGGGFVEHFDGNDWTVVHTTPAPLLGVWGTPDGVVLAVGARGALYYWSAKDPTHEWHAYSRLPSSSKDPNEPMLWGIAGRDMYDFGIAGGENRVFHANMAGSGFDSFDTLDDRLSFRAVSQSPGPSTNLFFGTNFLGLIAFTGSAPTRGAPISEDAGVYEMVQIARDDEAPDAAKKFIQGIWSTPSVVVAVGDDGRIYRYEPGRSELSRIPAPTDAPLGGVWGSSASDVWIVGDRELILHGALPLTTVH